MDRWAAADLLIEAILDRFGSVEAGAAAGLKLRHDGGSCFRSGHYQAEIDHLGIERSPGFVYEPETNGVVEKFLQTRCSNATATAHPAKPAPPSPLPTPPWHDRRR